MQDDQINRALTTLFSELVDGLDDGKAGFILNPGDRGLLHALEQLPPDAASRAADGGATIAAHAEHVRYGLSLMNRWAEEGGNPFAGADWSAAWRISAVDDARWREIRSGLHHEARRWRSALATTRERSGVELCGVISSVAHLAYHLGAIRQIDRTTRGPKQEQAGAP